MSAEAKITKFGIISESGCGSLHFEGFSIDAAYQFEGRSTEEIILTLTICRLQKELDSIKNTNHSKIANAEWVK